MANSLADFLRNRQPAGYDEDPMMAQQNQLAVLSQGQGMPANYIRNSMTGAVTSLQSQPQMPDSDMADVTRPVDMMGKKGYWSKDGSKIIAQDGSWVADPYRDTAASQAETAKNLDLQLKREQIANAQYQREGDQFIATPDGRVFNKRTGQYQQPPEGAVPGAGIPQTLLEKQYGRAPEGKRWTMGGQLEDIPSGQKQQDAQSVLGLVDLARPLVDKGTGSYLGSAAQTVAGQFGAMPEATAANAQLRALEGMLISKMPKMSGPQSDKDVLLYRQMAGQIGDPTVPQAAKKAALDMIQQINSRYGAPPLQAPAAIQQGQSAPQSAAQPQQNAQQILQAAQDAIRRGAPREAVMQRLQSIGITGGF